MARKYQKELTLEELAALPDEAIDTSDIPELDENFWKNARVVMPEERGKTQITAKFDADMVNWFKRQGRGYQGRMNAVLRSFYEAQRTSEP
jgi:uncharacterized protein (DUF4415 family)